VGAAIIVYQRHGSDMASPSVGKNLHTATAGPAGHDVVVSRWQHTMGNGIPALGSAVRDCSSFVL
jgi:hypothetical protein